jgi:hypothetical protein
MTQRLDRPLFLIAGAMAAAIGIGLLAGCTSSSLDDAAPAAADASSPQTGKARKAGAAETGAALEAEAEAQGPRDTGTFPNLNIRPQAANDQISPEETESEKGALTAAQKRQAASGSGIETTDPAVLKKLAETHAEDTLKAIDAQQ